MNLPSRVAKRIEGLSDILMTMMMMMTASVIEKAWDGLFIVLSHALRPAHDLCPTKIQNCSLNRRRGIIFPVLHSRRVCFQSSCWYINYGRRWMYSSFRINIFKK